MTTDTEPTGDPGAPTLAQRLAQHPRWGWRAGMRVLSPDAAYVVAATRRDGSFRLARQGPCRYDKRYVIAHGPEMAGAGFAPDLADDATAGVLLGMVREWQVEHDRDVRVLTGKVSCCGGHWTETLGEAVGRCLLACWALDDEASKPAPE